MLSSPLLIFLALALYGLLHSLLAANAAKRGAHRLLGRVTAARLYRLTYTLFAVFSFLPVLYLLWVLPDAPLYHIPQTWVWVCYTVQLAGLALAAWSLAVTDVWAFIGLRQLMARQPEGGVERLTVDGPYAWVRHPMYTGTLLFLWAAPAMTVNRLAFVLGITLYFIIGGYFEERKLLAQFGEDYAAYRRRTPMLLPR
ncbi:MAG: isoprenylcysteine carboxylmethyltransferase family protein, partial [Anaerolineae bacterium]